MCIELGDIDQAIHIFNEGLDLAKTSRNSKFEGIFLARIGDAYALTPQKQKAVEFYMQALNPLKKSKELAMVAEINQRLNRSTGNRAGSIKPPELESVVMPFHKSLQGKRLILMLARTGEFIKIGDNKMINYYITSVEEIMQDYHFNPKESDIRKRLSKQMGDLRKSNHHACATILKQKIPPLAVEWLRVKLRS
jgi:tetratricopeptide (TPR) repeat protein